MLIYMDNLIVDIVSPYNTIFGLSAINALRAVISTLYLTLKYLLPDGRIGTNRGDKKEAHKCYLSSLETTREELALVDVPHSKVPNIDFECWDPILGAEAKSITPTKDLKEVDIGPHAHQGTKIGKFMSVDDER